VTRTVRGDWGIADRIMLLASDSRDLTMRRRLPFGSPNHWLRLFASMITRALYSSMVTTDDGGAIIHVKGAKDVGDL
jgi:hypothetical protein